MAALLEVKPDVKMKVPDDVAEVLKEFNDVMPSELPRHLPPQRVVDHQI